MRSENLVVSHNGTYSYDDAGRLTNVADTVSSSGLGGNYTWNNDGTLAAYPGPGYTRKLSYDEEGRLTKISRDNGTTVTPVFEYGYGFDGGRRWRKDLSANTWDWYPCGVACCAGELVTMRSTNGGSSWSQQANRLTNSISSNGFVLSSLSGASLVVDLNQVVIRTDIVDGVGMNRSNTQDLLAKQYSRSNDETILNDSVFSALPSLALNLAQQTKPNELPKPVRDAINKCSEKCGKSRNDRQGFFGCMKKCLGSEFTKEVEKVVIDELNKYLFCKVYPQYCANKKGPCDQPDPDVDQAQACCSFKYNICITGKPVQQWQGCVEAEKRCYVKVGLDG